MEGDTGRWREIACDWNVTIMFSLYRSVCVMFCFASIEERIAAWKTSGSSTCVICSASIVPRSSFSKTAFISIAMLIAIDSLSLKNWYAV